MRCKFRGKKLCKTVIIREYETIVANFIKGKFVSHDVVYLKEILEKWHLVEFAFVKSSVPLLCVLITSDNKRKVTFFFCVSVDLRLITKVAAVYETLNFHIYISFTVSLNLRIKWVKMTRFALLTRLCSLVKAFRASL